MSNTTEPEGLYITSSKHVFCDGAGKIYLEAQLVLWELAGVVEKQGKDAKKQETKRVLIPFVREGQASTDPGRQKNKTVRI